MISNIGIGTYQLDNDTTYKIVKKALELGYRHIDTAQLYKNEMAIGKAISDSNIDRKDIFITTKISLKNMERNKITESINLSLKNLNTDYIDLVLLHVPTKNFVKNWIDLTNQDKNKVHYIGVSNFKIHHLKTLLENNLLKPFANQIEITPFNPSPQLVKFCTDLDITIIAHSSLTKGIKLDHFILKYIAEKHKVTTTTILLKWALLQNVKILPRTSNIEHLIENFMANAIILSNHEINLLNSLDCGFVTHTYK